MIKKLDNIDVYIDAPDCVINKLNELVDAVNRLHEEAENNARIRANHENLIDTLVQENNIHEKQIDELQMKAEPKTELDRPRKALEIAVEALKTVRRYTAINQFAPKSREAHIVAKKALEQITALEQKE